VCCWYARARSVSKARVAIDEMPVMRSMSMMIVRALHPPPRLQAY
jgi:hypothetical protein